VSIDPSRISFEGFKKFDLPESYLAGTKLKVSIEGLSAEPDRRSGGSAFVASRAALHSHKAAF
jgi:hypothetical protein